MLELLNELPSLDWRQLNLGWWELLAVIIKDGGVGERLKPAVLKTVRPERVSGVRIPPPPPYSRSHRCLLINSPAPGTSKVPSTNRKLSLGMANRWTCWPTTF